jgi:hypothetical protein
LLPSSPENENPAVACKTAAGSFMLSPLSRLLHLMSQHARNAFVPVTLRIFNPWFPGSAATELRGARFLISSM